MSIAANELQKSSNSADAVAEHVGHQSVNAFRQVFRQRMVLSPADWRRSVARR